MKTQHYYVSWPKGFVTECWGSFFHKERWIREGIKVIDDINSMKKLEKILPKVDVKNVKRK